MCELYKKYFHIIKQEGQILSSGDPKTIDFAAYSVTTSCENVNIDNSAVTKQAFVLDEDF